MTRRVAGVVLAALVVSLVGGLPAPVRAGGSVIHVSSTGDDDNDGLTLASAVSTVQEAVDRAGPGDTVLVEPGVYEGSIHITNSGTDGSPITVMSSVRHAARIAIPSGFEWEHGFLVTADHVEINGFEIFHEALTEDHWGSGISVEQSHHVTIANNYVHDVGGNGIAFIEFDHATVEGNIVRDVASWAPYQGSGISLYQARASDAASGFHNIVRGNVSYSNVNEVLSGGETTDGNGIIIDDFRNEQDDTFNTAFAHDTLIENNLVFDNGGKGIHTYLSDHVVVRNNTAFHNNQDPQNPAGWRGELSAGYSGDIVFANNIAVAQPGSGPLDDNVSIQIGGSSDVTVENNLTWGPDGGSAVDQESSTGVTMAGNVVGDPMFVSGTVNPTEADFRLQSGSPARDRAIGTHGVPTIDITRAIRQPPVDLGAYEYGADPIDDTGGGIPPGGVAPDWPDFIDTIGHVFEADIAWLAGSGITRGCDPPSNSRFCPDDPVTRGEMAAFLVRALGFPAASGIDFVDDDGSVFEADIERLAAANITRGCNPPSNTRFCPDEPVTRGQMAAFLRRASPLFG